MEDFHIHKSDSYNLYPSCFLVEKVLLTLFFFILAENLNAQTLSAEKIYEKVKDAVVVILAYDYNDELAAQGSGVVLNDKGYVVTNYHVLSGNERLELMHGEEIIPYVDIIGIDVEKDILILKIEERKFPAVKIGDVKNLKVGQRVYAIGSPMGFENTISEGIISGLRNYEKFNKNYIQITASISPGSSGGAVVNEKGQLIGISTLTAKEGQNLNFAIPIDEVLGVEIGSYSKNDKYKDFELFDKGIIAVDNGDYIGAIKYFSQFIKLYPDYTDAYYNRGFCKLNLCDYMGSILDFDTSIKINPDDYEAYFGRGNAKSGLGDYQSAINDYNKAIQINNNFLPAFLNRGLAKYKLEDYKGAIDDYNLVLDTNPLNESAYLNRGLVKYDSGDYNGAIKDYNKVIEFNPSDKGAYNNRAFSKLRLGDKYGACLDWSKAGELGLYDAYDLIKKYCN